MTEPTSRLADLILDISLAALAFTPAARVEGLARQFLSRGSFAGEAATAWRAAKALSLAADLAIFAPSGSGSNAIDRCLRTLPPEDAEEAQAARALRQARFRVLRVEGREPSGSFRLTDLATGEKIRLFESHADSSLVGAVLATRLCPLEGAGFVATGPSILLDEVCLGIAGGFFRPNGKGLTNAERCAEAIYRHVIRHGTLGEPPEEEEDEPAVFPYGPESSATSALAHRWAELAPGVEPPAAEIAEARGLTAPHHLMDAIALAGIASEYGLGRLSGAYDRIAMIQIETMQRRAQVRSGWVSLDDVAGRIAERIGQGKSSAADRARFADLRRRAMAAGAGKRDDLNLDRLLQVIRGLRAKTVDQGCTEAEAIAAAAKVAELLDRYGLSLSDVDFRKQTCAGFSLETTRRRSGPIDPIVPHIAGFFDCRSWYEKTEGETLRHIFFGLPGDVEAARYLYELVEKAFETETLAFKTGDLYRDLHASERRDGSNSFQLGLARGIIEKLDKLRQEREAALHRSSGRDLIVVKASIVDEEMEKLGLAFTAKSVGAKKYVMTDAYAAGQEAGERFEYRAAIGA